MTQVSGMGVDRWKSSEDLLKSVCVRCVGVGTLESGWDVERTGQAVEA